MTKLIDRIKPKSKVQWAAFWFFVGGVVIGLVGLANDQWQIIQGFGGRLLAQYYANLSAEMWSIAATVFIIDSLYQQRDEAKELDQLKKDFSSSANETALRAAEELRRRGHLRNDELHNSTFLDANLANANLSSCIFQSSDFIGGSFKKAHMYSAMFKGCTLYDVNFNKANLAFAEFEDCVLIGIRFKNTIFNWTRLTNTEFEYCDFSGAISLQLHQLSMARKLRTTKLMDGKMYDGRFNLADDLAHAEEYVDEYLTRTEQEEITNRDEFMADFYGVSIKRYRRGQKWWEENKDEISRKTSKLRRLFASRKTIEA